MELFVLLLLAALAIILAAATGLVADSRDYADWRPSVDGMRQPPR
jgi:hypothetical protein